MPKRLAKGATIPTEFPSVPHVRPNSSNSSQLPIPILTNAYSLSDSLQFPPPTTLHSSHFRCFCCCCLLSPLSSLLLLHSSPAFLVFFFITFSIVTRQRRLAGDTATPTWPHSRAHNEVAAAPPPNLHLLLPWRRDAGTGSAKWTIQSTRRTARRRGALQCCRSPHPLSAKKQCARISKFY